MTRNVSHPESKRRFARRKNSVIQILGELEKPTCILTMPSQAVPSELTEDEGPVVHEEPHRAFERFQIVAVGIQFHDRDPRRQCTLRPQEVERALLDGLSIQASTDGLWKDVGSSRALPYLEPALQVNPGRPVPTARREAHDRDPILQLI